MKSIFHCWRPAAFMLLAATAALTAAGCGKKAEPAKAPTVQSAGDQTAVGQDVTQMTGKTKAGLDRIQNASDTGQSDIDSFDAKPKEPSN